MNAGYYEQADAFINETRHILSIRDALSPDTGVDIDEIGCAYQGFPIKDEFWPICAANFAYLFAKLAPLGVDVLGMSQVIGYPAMDGLSWEWPSTSMIDWISGKPNARFWLLKMLIDLLGNGEKAWLPTQSSSDMVGLALIVLIDVNGGVLS